MSSLNGESKSSTRFYRFGDFELDVSAESLLRNGEKLNINRRMFQVLYLLVDRSGEIVTKNEFFEKVWNGSFVEDNNLTVTITALRKILGDDAKQARFIENLPRIGYRFVARVDLDSTSAINEVKREGPTGVEQPIKELTSTTGFRRWGRAAAVGVVALLLVVLTVAAVRYEMLWTSAASTSSQGDSIAVLPFEIREANNEYLADGLADGLIDSLSRVPGLRVIDRHSSFQYKNKTIDPGAVGRDLNVRSIVTGQIEEIDDTLIITTELTDVTSTSRPWRTQYRRKKSELFTIQQEIFQAIMRDLLSNPDNRLQSRRPTDNAEAYDLYLKGRYYWNKRNETDIRRSIELFRSAIDKDPTFAKAYVGLGNAYSIADLSPQGIGQDERIVLSTATIKKALEIDDTIGDAYAVLGINKVFHEWDLAGAEVSYKRAIELNPNDATTRHWYAEMLSMQGRFEESYIQYDLALALDPLSLPIRTDMAFARYYAKDFDAAIELLNKAKQLNPEYGRTYEFLMFAYREKELFIDAVNCLEKRNDILLLNGEITQQGHDLGSKFVKELRDAAIRNEPKQFWQAELTGGPPDPIYKAFASSKLGQNDKAFEFLETAFKSRSTGMIWLKVQPELEALRSDPRYNDLLRRIGF